MHKRVEDQIQPPQQLQLSQHLIKIKTNTRTGQIGKNLKLVILKIPQKLKKEFDNQIFKFGTIESIDSPQVGRESG